MGSGTKKNRLGDKKSLSAIFITSKMAFPAFPNENPNEDHPIKRTSITLEDPVYEAGQQIADKRGFGQSFSAYIAWLIKRDAEGGVTREDATLQHRAAKAPAKAASKSVKPAKRAPRAKRGK